jgi:copper(I)-binding protein
MTSPRSGLAGVIAGLVVGGLLLAGCGDDDGSASYGPNRELVVEDVTVVEPAGANSAVYLTIRNEGPDADRLVEIRSAAADRVELHETRAGDDGLMRMVPVETLDLPVGETVQLEPGGLHAMLYGIADLELGDTTSVELVFEHGAPLTVEATVRSHAELIG